MKRTVTYLSAAVLLLLILLGTAYAALHRFLDSPLRIENGPMVYEIRSGAAFATVADALGEMGVVEKPEWLRWYARLSGQAQKIRAGEYAIEAGTTARQLLEKFVSGDVRLYSFTIIEGWTFRELLDALANAAAVRQTLRHEEWPTLLEWLGADHAYPEGLFLPETYFFPKNSRDKDVLRQAFNLMRSTLADEWNNRAESLPIDSPYEALILASIIEKETGRADERAKIAGVFVRRLQKRMRLQTDPTVIYGIGDSFDGNLTRTHLRTDTAYNTYTRHGLPPTPIALPGRAAINAALHPEEGNALYFVATGLGDGGHEFSDTKAEHDAAVRRFLARERAARVAEQHAQ